MKLLLDCQWGIGGKVLAKTILSSDVHVQGKRIVSGTNVRKHWVERRYSFVIECNREFEEPVTLEPLSPDEKAPRMALQFGEGDGPLIIKIGYSLVDEEGARRNMDAECPGFDFDAVRAARQAELVRDVFEKFYVNKHDGLCGNDDCGQMSAWYLFSAMGFYPLNPASGEYVLGAPQLPKVTMRVTRDVRRETSCGGKSFTVIAKNLSAENKYVKSVTLNGVPLEGFIIRHEDILKGGELVFEMGC